MLEEERISYCGIVFLNQFFSKLFLQEGLLVEGKFENRKAEITALQYLYYLASSKLTFEAQKELHIFKILLAIPLDTEIIFLKPLSKSQQNNCQILLQSFTDQWKSLQSVNAENIQLHFFQKEGDILENAGKIEINLETSSLDVLLTNFPYSYQVFTFSWLQKIIRVNI